MQRATAARGYYPGSYDMKRAVLQNFMGSQHDDTSHLQHVARLPSKYGKHYLHCVLAPVGVV